MRPPTLILLLILPLPFAACSAGRTPAELCDEGYDALAHGERATAARCFRRAIEHVEAGDRGLILDLELGLCRADEDGARAVETFEAVAKARPEEVGIAHYTGLASDLGARGQYVPAVSVLQGAKARWPDNERLGEAVSSLGLLIEDAIQREKNPDAAKALDSLDGLGYTGKRR